MSMVEVLPKEQLAPAYSKISIRRNVRRTKKSKRPVSATANGDAANLNEEFFTRTLGPEMVLPSNPTKCSQPTAKKVQKEESISAQNEVETSTLKNQPITPTQTHNPIDSKSQKEAIPSIANGIRKSPVKEKSVAEDVRTKDKFAEKAEKKEMQKDVAKSSPTKVFTKARTWNKPEEVKEADKTPLKPVLQKKSLHISKEKDAKSPSTPSAPLKHQVSSENVDSTSAPTVKEILARQRESEKISSGPKRISRPLGGEKSSNDKPNPALVKEKQSSSPVTRKPSSLNITKESTKPSSLEFSNSSSSNNLSSPKTPTAKPIRFQNLSPSPVKSGKDVFIPPFLARKSTSPKQPNSSSPTTPIKQPVVISRQQSTPVTSSSVTAKPSYRPKLLSEPGQSSKSSKTPTGSIRDRLRMFENNQECEPVTSSSAISDALGHKRLNKNKKKEEPSADSSPSAENDTVFEHAGYVLGPEVLVIKPTMNISPSKVR